MNFDNVSRIAYLGPDASFSEMAKDYFCEKYSIKAFPTPMTSVKEIMEYIKETPLTLGVLPIENSVVGTVRETLDYLMDSKDEKISILSEVVMPISYCLLSRTTEFYSISGVIAHQQALGQCSNFIKSELPMHLNIIEVTNQAEAARTLADYNLTYAAIGSKKLAQTYNLNVLKENINDDKTNCTCFVLIGGFETQSTGNDKTTLVFMTDDTPGALMEILNIFYKNNVNLSYISSQKARQFPDKYVFVVSFDGHITDENLKNTIAEVRNKVKYLKFLGSYEK